MSRVELPGGAWAELASPKKVQERKRRRYVAAMTDLSAATSSLPQVPNPNPGPDQPVTIPDPAHFTSAHMELSDRVGDMLILCLVRDWSLGDITEEAVGNLDAEVFDVLFRACRDLGSDLLPNYAPDPDPKASTGGLPGSPTESSRVQPISETPSFAVTS